MSKALKFLSEARPEAMAAYFEFLRNNGNRLDPRTRALISIITKIANQTESGLRQYAKKAIREGVSADEILDAMLMAFPALGLTKIVWAVDILIECGIFGDPATDDTSKTWHDVCAADFDGETFRTDCDGKHVLIAHGEEGYRAFEAKCPHHGTSLAYCDITDGELECPLHGWRFKVSNGACVRFGTQDLAEFDTRVVDNRLMVSW